MNRVPALLVAAAILVVARLVAYPRYGAWAWYLGLVIAAGVGLFLLRRARPASLSSAGRRRAAESPAPPPPAASPESPSLAELRGRLESGDATVRARTATKLAQLHDVESAPLFVKAIYDEYRQRTRLAENYQRLIDATGGYVQRGGTDDMRREWLQIDTVHLADTCVEALVTMGAAAVPHVLPSVAEFESRTSEWNFASKFPLSLLFIKLLERLDPAACADRIAELKRLT